MTEEWATVVYNGEVFDDYEVSTMGRVRSLKRGKVKVLKQCEDKNGYLRVSLYKDGKQKYAPVHRIVACTFIPNPNNKSTVNHLSEQKDDNRVENLSWATVDEQIQYGTRNERVSKTLTGRGKKVLCVETGEVFDNAYDVQRKTGLSQANVDKCCRGKKRYKTCGGFHWKFIE